MFRLNRRPKPDFNEAATVFGERECHSGIPYVDYDPYVPPLSPADPHFNGGNPIVVTDEFLDCIDEQKLESERDRIAQEIAEEIRATDDWDEYEYGVVIYEGLNGLRRGKWQKQENPKLPFALKYDDGPDKIVGFIHSHPTRSYSVPSPSDWLSARTALRDTNSRRDDFAHYILDYDTRTLYEYDLGDPGDEHPTGREDGSEEQKNDAGGICSV